MKKIFLLLFLLISNIAFAECWGHNPKEKFKRLDFDSGIYVLGEAFEVTNINKGYHEAFNDAIVKKIPTYYMQFDKGYIDTLDENKLISNIKVVKPNYGKNFYNLGRIREFGFVYEKNPNGTYNVYVLLGILDLTDAENQKFKQFAKKGMVADVEDIVDKLISRPSLISP